MSAASAPLARIVCLPHAGGSASAYAHWAARLAPTIALCPLELPGRGARLREAPLTSMAALADDVLASLAGWRDRPVVLFGHSMGGALALEVATRMWREGAAPAALVVSGCRAPHLPLQRSEPLFALPTPALLAELVRIGGLPAGLLDVPGLIDLFLPAIRADLQCREQCLPAAGAPLPLPIHVFGGSADQLAPPEELHAWARHSSLPLTVTICEGGHFFIREHARQVVDCLARLAHDTINPGKA